MGVFIKTTNAIAIRARTVLKGGWYLKTSEYFGGWKKKKEEEEEKEEEGMQCSAWEYYIIVSTKGSQWLLCNLAS